MKVTMILQIVIETVFKGLERLEELEIEGQIETIQTRVLFRSTRIMRRAMESYGDLLSLWLQ